jgi:NAD(P)-dependent dehydrogenase (short-subunit alcohol dehydrogenase family)
VNAVCPGAIETPILGKIGLPPDVLGEVVARLVARIGTPDEVARAVLFLASDDASYVNGEELFVDGGMVK